MVVRQSACVVPSVSSYFVLHGVNCSYQVSHAAKATSFRLPYLALSTSSLPLSPMPPSRARAQHLIAAEHPHSYFAAFSKPFLANQHASSLTKQTSPLPCTLAPLLLPASVPLAPQVLLGPIQFNHPRYAQGGEGKPNDHGSLFLPPFPYFCPNYSCPLCIVSACSFASAPQATLLTTHFELVCPPSRFATLPTHPPTIRVVSPPRRSIPLYFQDLILVAIRGGQQKT